MGMKQTLDVINGMEADGIIDRYAIAGAVAAYNYIEPAVTEDLDLLVSFDRVPETAQTGLVTLTPIFSYLKGKGHMEHEGEGIVIGGWPVQFLPVADSLDSEALAQAHELELRIADALVKTRVLRPEHLVAIALRVGRPKDLIRITQFLDDSAVDPRALTGVLIRHRLTESWRAFCARTGIADPCAL
jgi:hypothetical protein